MPTKDDIEMNKERANQIAVFSEMLAKLKPRAGASIEWREMLLAVERAKKISEKYRDEYESPQEGDAAEEAKKKQIALEELTGAMNLLRYAAHGYAEHKYDSEKFLEGKDADRFLVANDLEEYCKKQCDYLMPKAVEKINEVHEDAGYFSEESIVNDIEYVYRYDNDLYDLGRKTTFNSKEYTEMERRLRELKHFQKNMAADKQFNKENDELYFGYTDDKGNYVKGYVDRALDSVNAYIKHRLKEGITKELYAQRLDVASRLKKYLVTIKEGAERTREDRFNDYEYKENAVKHEAAFQEKFKAAEKVLSRVYDRTKTDVPADQIPAVKEAMCTIYAYQKYKRELNLVNAGKLDNLETIYVRVVKSGRYDALINEFKAKQMETDGYVNRHAGDMKAVRYFLNGDSFWKLVDHIDKEQVNKKPIAGEETYKKINFLMTRAVENYKNDAKEKLNGKMDKFFLAQFTAQRSLLGALKELGPLSAKNQQNISALNSLGTSFDDANINNMAEKISRSEEFRAVLDRYEGQKNLSGKLEDMYRDYVQLKIYAEKHNGELPDDLDKFFQQDVDKKPEENKPREVVNDAKKNEEMGISVN